MNPLTQQGIAAYKAGNKAEARRLLKQALQQDPTDIPAWLCLSGTIEEAAGQAYCFQMVLRMDPNNAIALKGMAKINENRQGAAGQPVAPIRETPPQPDFRAELFQAAPFTADINEADSPPPAPSRAAWSEPAPEQASQASNLAETPIPTPSPAPARHLAADRPAAPVRKAARRSASKGLSSTFKTITRKTGMKPWMLGVLAGMSLLACLVLGILFSVINNASAPGQVAQNPNLVPLPPTETPTPGLPPTYTPTPTPTITPTRTPTPTATYMVLGPGMVAQMKRIQQEVVTLRGLDVQPEVTSYIITKPQAAELLNNLMINEVTLTELENQQRTLTVLGLVDPSYDLVDVALNQAVDNIGGFYLPEKKELFVLAQLRFGGMEHWVYSHEFDHALVDQAFDLSKMQTCPGDDQRCQAIKALVEGDAQFLMLQWVQKYATPQDYYDFLNYRPPLTALSDQPVPDYLAQEMNFPYVQGLEFITYLHRRAGWTGVNRAYQNPPASTEQILHPEKYSAGEEPIPVVFPAVQAALGGDWQVIADNTLGEWASSLLLSHGADALARLPSEVAAKAAGGWGGDHYQAFYSPSANKSALAVQWAWDRERDATEYETALKKHLEARYPDGAVEQAGASCWENTRQATCVITQPTQTLWLTAPDIPTILSMWAQYPDFQPE